MPYVICSTCPTAFYVDKKDIPAVKAEHTEFHQNGTGKAEFIVFNSAEEVTPTWYNECVVALGARKWKPKRIEG